MVKTILLNRNEHASILADHCRDPVTKKILEVGDEVVICARCRSIFLKCVWEYTLNGIHCGQKETINYQYIDWLIRQPSRKICSSDLTFQIQGSGLNKKNYISIDDSSKRCHKYFLKEPLETALNDYFYTFGIGIKDEAILPFHTVYINNKRIHLKYPKHLPLDVIHNDSIEIDFELLNIKKSYWIMDGIYQTLNFKSIENGILVNNTKVNAITLYFYNKLQRTNCSVINNISKIIESLHLSQIEKYSNGQKINKQ
jgi:hypothetical protein